MTTTYRPVIIIGAPRSGTNILRDVLTGLPGMVTWPCDEINYIWRHGNIGHPTDEFTPSMATPKAARYIRARFGSLASGTKGSIVVEKTCANSLRVGFVDAIFPEALYLFILRDGRNVVPSAMMRWRGIMEMPYLPYVMQKVRFVPPADLPFYAVRYLSSQVHRLFSGEGRLSFWGPRFEGMVEYASSHTLPEVCAAQWRRCVERSEQDLAGLPQERICRVRYEELTGEPEREIRRIIDFLGERVPEEPVAQAASSVAVKNTDAWNKKLTPEDRERVLPIVRPLLEKYSYVPAADDRKARV